MDEVPVPVDQDVPVMPVLDLQQERHDGIPGQRLYEVALSTGEASRVGLAICLPVSQGACADEECASR